MRFYSLNIMVWMENHWDLFEIHVQFRKWIKAEAFHQRRIGVLTNALDFVRRKFCLANDYIEFMQMEVSEMFLITLHGAFKADIFNPKRFSPCPKQCK